MPSLRYTQRYRPTAYQPSHPSLLHRKDISLQQAINDNPSNSNILNHPQKQNYNTTHDLPSTANAALTNTTMKTHRARVNPPSTKTRAYKPLHSSTHRPSQAEIALISFLIVLSLTFFLLAVYVSIRHRRLLGSPRLRGKHWDRHWNWEDGVYHQHDPKQKQRGQGTTQGDEEGHLQRCRRLESEDKSRGGGGRGEDGERGSVLGVVNRRVVGVLNEVGRRVSGMVVASSRAEQPQRPVRDVEFGVGSGAFGYGYGHGYGYSYGDDGKIHAQVDGFEAAGREPVLMGRVGGMAWPRKGYLVGPAACLLRRRGELRMSAESECPV